METGSTDPCFNLAFEEYVLTHRLTGTYLILWQNENSIIIGQNQNTEEEINRSYVDAHGVKVVRRTTGGGAVYHDTGNLNYSFITDRTPNEVDSAKEWMMPVIHALEKLGVHAEPSGRNDILVEGRKISGTAQRIFGSRILFHGTLLFDTDPEVVSSALRVNPKKFESKSVKSVRSRIGNIRDFLPVDMDMAAFWDFLKKTIFPDAIREVLSPAEMEEVLRLREEKYSTFAWNFGRPIPYTFKNHRRWPGGILEIAVQVDSGRIKDIAFSGDFLSTVPLDTLVEALKGVPFSRSEIEKVLNRIPLQDYFGTISEKEVLDTFFEYSE